MQGSMLIYRPDQPTPEYTALTSPPPLKELQKLVGGYIEAVPGFMTVQHDGQTHNCFAFCNEQGKLQELPMNIPAQRAWEAATGRIITSDVLVGTVVVLWGDAAFREAL